MWETITENNFSPDLQWKYLKGQEMAIAQFACKPIIEESGQKHK
jgi:hypothetical protein